MNPSGVVVMAVVYVTVGMVIATVLARRGHPTATAMGAVPCWPLFISLVADRASPRPTGPRAPRIESVLSALREAMDDPGAMHLAVPDDLKHLAGELHRADARIAAADRLLATVRATATQTNPDLALAIDQLAQARARADAEIDAVLDDAVRLQLQIGVRSLAGQPVPIREQLEELSARLAAIDELSSPELPAP